MDADFHNDRTFAYEARLQADHVTVNLQIDAPHREAALAKLKEHAKRDLRLWDSASGMMIATTIDTRHLTINHLELSQIEWDAREYRVTHAHRNEPDVVIHLPIPDARDTNDARVQYARLALGLDVLDDVRVDPVRAPQDSEGRAEEASARAA